VALAIGASAIAFAHGPLQDQIDEASAQIGREPADARLYLRRGELHRLHEDWDAALADYGRAAALSPADDTIDFLRGRALQEAGKPEAAKAALDRFLERHPNHPDALIARARALRALGEYRAAAADYTRAIERLPKPDPDHYLERARIELSGLDYNRALAGIDAGIARLGQVPALQDLGIEIELKMGRVDAALLRLDRMAASSPRRETWLARRGEILAQAGRKDEARSAYKASLTAIEALPVATRRTRAMADLESRVRGALASI